MNYNNQKQFINDLIDELVKRKIIRKINSQEEMLKEVLENYSKLRVSIEKNNMQISRLEKEQQKLQPNLSKTSKVALKDSEKLYLYTDETLQNRINELKQIVIRAQAYMDYIKDTCDVLKDDEYYPAIEWLYFEKKTYKEVSEFFGWPYATINYNCKRLIKEISSYLFSDVFISTHS